MSFNIDKIVRQVERINQKVTDPFFRQYVTLEVSSGGSTFYIFLERQVDHNVPVWQWSYFGPAGLIEPTRGWYVHNFITGAVHLGHVISGAVMRLHGVYFAGNTFVGRRGGGEKVSSKGTLPAGSLSWKVTAVGGVAF